MVDLAFALAVTLLIAGIIGSVVPMIPGPFLSILGVVGYWWSTGYAEPSTLALVGLIVVALLAFVVEFVASALSARAGGASWRVTGIAGVAGVALLFVTGPLLMIVGVSLLVFLLELRRHDDVSRGVKAATYTTIGIFGSSIAQVLLTFLVLLGFVLSVA
ncbi:DUF456 domain-containing protein [Natranaeroarchaeum aerophilus]|uniref:DUF456 domain-containing protein n=1 Tax=Natranaeroarchaeum aerophilus TaxID=2917711 RepID=A0AAE3K7N2_9EURY|nr:DUF456 domain-containing protein [Natranaeroarchaeum aerophilus]MCL9814094.1 DUF456 domain-containing protein [Natranaeroarchaeum aerophilus]